MTGEIVDWVGVGQRLRHVRKTSRLSQREFGLKFSVSQNMISLYEKGRSHASVEFYMQVARFGSQTIEWLLTGCENRGTETLNEMRELHCQMMNSLSTVQNLLDREGVLTIDERLISETEPATVRRLLLDQESHLPPCLRQAVQNGDLWNRLAISGREACAIRILARMFGKIEMTGMQAFLEFARVHLEDHREENMTRAHLGL